jgi:hypothetical protein
MSSLLAFRCDLAMPAVNKYYKRPHELPRHTLVLATHYTVLYLTRTPDKKQKMDFVERIMRLMSFVAGER